MSAFQRQGHIVICVHQERWPNRLKRGSGASSGASRRGSSSSSSSPILELSVCVCGTVIPRHSSFASRKKVFHEILLTSLSFAPPYLYVLGSPHFHPPPQIPPIVLVGTHHNWCNFEFVSLLLRLFQKKEESILIFICHAPPKHQTFMIFGDYAHKQMPQIKSVPMIAQTGQQMCARSSSSSSVAQVLPGRPQGEDWDKNRAGGGR